MDRDYADCQVVVVLIMEMETCVITVIMMVALLVTAMLQIAG